MKESLKHLTLESSESDSDWRSTNSGYADLPTMIAENDLGTMKRGKRLDFNVSSIFSLWSIAYGPSVKPLKPIKTCCYVMELRNTVKTHIERCKYNEIFREGKQTRGKASLFSTQKL